MTALTIAFAMHQEPGHHMGTFRLAKALRSRGHRVVYLGIPDLKTVIEEHNFEFIPFADDLLPGEYQNNFQINTPSTFFRWWHQRRHNEGIFSKYLNKIEDGTLDKCLWFDASHWLSHRLVA